MKELYFEEIKKEVLNWLTEDDVARNIYYSRNLPDKKVKLSLKIKSNVVLSGSDYFSAAFNVLGVNPNVFESLTCLEGKNIESGKVLEFDEPISFGAALTGERLALNLLQHASSISTYTNKFVKIAEEKNIKILDTRKTTPGFRALEKYAVRVGGGYNHRFGQTDLWMIKDNHKTCLGGLKGAFKFFQSQGAFYQSIMAEIHDIDELKEALDLGIKHLMLDNFTRDQILEAISLKKTDVTYEVSGGVRLENLENYLINGVDVISVGAITNSAPRVDLSLKYRPV